MTLGMQSHQGASEQVELHCEFGGNVSVYITKHLMGSEDILRIVLEVKN